MIARASRRPTELPDEPRAGRVTAHEARAALLRARPSADEVLSLWPADRQQGIVLTIRVGPIASVSILAQPREAVTEGLSAELLRDLHRIRDDVPVVIELYDRRAAVLPLRALRRSSSSASFPGPSERS